MGTSYRITGLEPYKEYQVYVSAYNVDNGKYLYGAEASVKDFTLPTYPSSPSMTFTKVSTSQVNVLISVPKYPNGPITGYVLRWCPKRRCYGSNVGEREILQSNAGTQAVTGLKFWTEYVFSVSAFNLLPTDNARIYSDVVNDSVITMPFSPAGPQPFKVVALSATSVKLSWEAPVNPDVTPSHYRLFWCTKDNRFCFNADVGNVREAVISPLAPWTTYTFMIKALVQFTGPWLNSQVSTVTGRTWAAEPSRPTSLLVTKQQATTVDVSWQMPRDPVGPLDGFRIRICPELGTCPPMGLISRYKTLNSKTLTHSFYGLEAYTNYQVQVRAFNLLPNGETAEGDVAVVAVTTAPSSPSQPTRLQVKALNSSALGVTWRPPSHPNGPVKGYQVTWWKTGGTSTDDIEDRLNNKTVFLPGEASSFTITHLEAYKTYAVQVARINGDRNSTWDGAAAHAEGITDPEPCPPPTKLSATAVKVNATSSKAVITWAPPNGTFDPPIQGYYVHICKIEVNRGILAEGKCQYSNTSESVFTFTFEGLENLADYGVVVRAYVLHDGRYIEGNEATEFVATEAPPIPTVANLNYTASNGSAVTLSWSRVTGLEQYSVLYNVALYLTEDDTLIFSQNVNGTDVSFDALKPWTQYTVRVSACLPRSTKLQCGDPGVLRFETPPTGPSKVTELEVSVVNSTSLKLKWEAPSDTNGPLSGYQLTWWKTSENPSLDVQERLNNKTVLLSHDARSFLLVELDTYTTYAIEVVAINVTMIRQDYVEDAEWVSSDLPQRSNYTITVAVCILRGHDHKELIGIQASVVNSTAIQVTWNSPKDPTGKVEDYRITWWKTGETSVSGTGVMVPEDTETFIISELDSYESYIIQITSTNGDVLGVVSGVKTDPSPSPRPPGLVLKTMEVGVLSAKVVVGWDAPSVVKGPEVGGYIVVICPTEDNETALDESSCQTKNVSAENTTVDFEDLEKLADYVVKVRAYVTYEGRLIEDPREPRNVRVHVINSTSLSVTWNAPSSSSGPEEGYQITWWRTGAISDDTTQSLNGTTFVTADSGVFIITHLEPYEHYVVQVARGNGDQSGAWEERGVRVAGLTDPEPSPQPSGLTFQAISSSSETSTVAVTWNPAHQTSGPPLQGYVVTICPVQDDSERSLESGCRSRNTSAAELTAVFEDLKKFTDYDVEIWAYVEHDGRIIKGDVATKTLSTDPPDIPAVDDLNLSLSNQSVAHVTWSRPAGLEEYRVVYNVKVFLKTSGEKVFEVIVNETQVTFSNLTYRTDFTVQVVVCIVRTARRSCGGSGSVDFQTSDDDPKEGYQITWWHAGTTSGDTTQSPNGTTLVAADSGVFIITDLEPYEHYVVQVARGNGDQSSAWEERGVRVAGLTDPEPSPQPSGLTFQAISASSKTSTVAVTWNPAHQTSGPPIQGYVVTICPVQDDSERSPESGCSSRNTSAAELTAVFEDLKKFTDYDVEIWAYVEHDGRIIKGDVATKTLSTDPPDIPAVDNLNLSLSNQSVAHVTWSRPAGLEEYRVVYNVKVFLKTSGEEVFEITVNETQVALSNLTFWTDFTKPAGLEGFQVVFNVTVYETTDGNIVLLQDVNESETYLTGLKQGGNYTVAVSTCLVRPTRRRCGEASSTVFQTTRAGATLTSFEAKALNSTALMVNWQPAGDQDAPSGGYRITWWKSKNDTEQRNFVGTVTVPGDATNFTITGLTPFETYSIEIANINGQGSDAWETIAGKAEAMTDPAPYPKPWRVTVKPTRLNTTTSRAVISWNPPNGTFDPPMQGFILRVCRFANKTDIDESSCTTSTTSSNDTTITIEALDNFGEYLVEIRAYVEHDDRIVRGRRGLALFSTEAPPIGTVESLGFRDLAATSVYVSWKEPADLERFDVSYNVTLYAPAFMEEERRRWANGTGIVLSSLEPWTNYTVGVSACLVGTTRTQCGNSSHVEFSTPPSAPGIPRNLEVTTTENRRTLIWQAPLHSNGPLSGYEVSVRCSLGNTNVNSSTYNIDSTVRSFALSDAEPRASCQVTVRAYNIYRDEDDWLYGPAARLKYTQPVPEGIVTPQPN
ncbi:cell adhesion molecule, putative [Ixodes scapularis]|uniref:Cell adhesion molecule, putative n=1 Tax=Ixodes scapularis TaxID=6945 RepID=B7QFI5_IXOSC|nr:cell adhesion molecule, putative [Ixodes scapularis]|eukprot:XP_002414299.1 cell adhesion molecule, putative [Ixodes scapularis]